MFFINLIGSALTVSARKVGEVGMIQIDIPMPRNCGVCQSNIIQLLKTMAEAIDIKELVINENNDWS